jgi:enamine deaminase RidA (YjgF/YER057c/UK114 family)
VTTGAPAPGTAGVKIEIEPASFPWMDASRYAFCLGMEAGPAIWLSGHTAARYEADRNVVTADGDLETQTRIAYEKARVVLEAAGLGLGDVVQSIEYLAPCALDAEDAAMLARLRSEYFSAHRPALSTVAVNSLLRPEALVELEMVASRAPSAVVEAAGAVARRAGELLMIPALDAPGEDLEAQARAIYGRAEELLDAAGLGWEHVVKTTEFVAASALRDYRATAEVRRERFGAGDSSAFPASSGIIMERLATPGALLQVEFIASSEPRAAVEAPWPHHPRLTYAPAVRAGRLLFISGMAAFNTESNTTEHVGDVIAQSRYVYENMARLLDAAGGSLESVVKTVEYVAPAGRESYPRTGRVRTKLFDRPYPASTGVICERLLRSDLLIEVDAVAVLP